MDVIFGRKIIKKMVTELRLLQLSGTTTDWGLTPSLLFQLSMDVIHKKSGSPSQKLPNSAPNYLNCDCFGSLKLELTGV